MTDEPKPRLGPDDIVDPLCEWISEGKTLSDFCRQPGMPRRSTLYEWIEKDDALAGRIARARVIGFDEIAEQCFKIADDGTNDTYTDDDGRQRTDRDVIERSKIRIHTRLQLLAKWDPKRYGSKPDDREHGPAVEPDSRYD